MSWELRHGRNCRQTGRRAGFTKKTPSGRCVRCQLRCHDLDRDYPIEPSVVGPKDNPHPAGSDDFGNVVLTQTS